MAAEALLMTNHPNTNSFIQKQYWLKPSAAAVKDDSESKDLIPNHTYSLPAQLPDWTTTNYLHVSNGMARFAVAKAEELAANDDCATCLDSMLTACKLPCGHLFHNSCLEQDNSCPTCSTSFDISGDGALERSQQQGAGVEENMGPVGAAADARPHVNPHNRFFHFDGSLIASWLPSFLLTTSLLQTKSRVTFEPQATVWLTAVYDWILSHRYKYAPYISLWLELTSTPVCKQLTVHL